MRRFRALLRRQPFDNIFERAPVLERFLGVLFAAHRHQRLRDLVQIDDVVRGFKQGPFAVLYDPLVVFVVDGGADQIQFDVRAIVRVRVFFKESLEHPDQIHGGVGSFRYGVHQVGLLGVGRFGKFGRRFRKFRDCLGARLTWELQLNGGLLGERDTRR